MIAPSRQRLQVDERRTQLLDLAIQLFGGRSYEDISIDEFAKKGGISKGLLYHYFPSKRALYVAAVGRAAEQLLEKTHVDGGGASASSLETVRRGLDAYLAYVEEHAAAYAFLLRSGIGSDAEVAGLVEATRDAFAKRIGAGLGLTEHDAEGRILVRGWVGFVEATSLAWAESPSGITRERLAELILGAFAAGVQLVKHK
ncbi:MAG: TetR/AcrR family transcriptional regulator [Myxococcales bacterium]|nr:TetR/AcrR family transcriptional regulator [Myxococcales bacterium]